MHTILLVLSLTGGDVLLMEFILLDLERCIFCVYEPASCPDLRTTESRSCSPTTDRPVSWLTISYLVSTALGITPCKEISNPLKVQRRSPSASSTDRSNVMSSMQRQYNCCLCKVQQNMDLPEVHSRNIAWVYMVDGSGFWNTLEKNKHSFTLEGK